MTFSPNSIVEILNKKSKEEGNDLTRQQQPIDPLVSPLGKMSQYEPAVLIGKVSRPISESLPPAPPLNAHATSSLAAPSTQISTIKESWHQLIIIGNGFDLECGLRSSFGHFIAARKEYFNHSDSDNMGPTFHRTIWDCILDEKKDGNWCDVEGAIAEWIAPRDSRRESGAPLNLSSNLTLFGKTLKKVSELNAIGRGVHLSPNETKDRVASYLFLERSRENDDPWTKERLLRLTREDLSIFESDFAMYLGSEIDRSTGYQQAAEDLMKTLMRIGIPDADRHEIETCVLSFNYTKPHKLFRVDGNLVSYVNIHGELGGEIIFGIDGTGRMNDIDALPYTKTYRLMALNVPNIGAIVHRNISGSPDAAVNVIKFYGHSLGQADYSYFQAIFDAANLYDSLTRLEFFVRPYERNDNLLSEEEVREEMMGKVISLLSSYGATLDNKDHGRNLIHKLLIEGRLRINII